MYAPKSALPSAAASHPAAAASKAASSMVATPAAATARPSPAARAARHGAGLGVTAHAHAATRNHVASHAAATRAAVSGAAGDSLTRLRVTAAHAAAESAAYDPASANAARSAAFRVSSYSSLTSSAEANPSKAPHSTRAGAASKHDVSAAASARSPPTLVIARGRASRSAKSACARTSAFTAIANGTTRLATARSVCASGTIVAGDARISVSGPSASCPPKYTRACARQSNSPHSVTASILVRKAKTKGAAATAVTPTA